MSNQSLKLVKGIKVKSRHHNYSHIEGPIKPLEPTTNFMITSQNDEPL